MIVNNFFRAPVKDRNCVFVFFLQVAAQGTLAEWMKGWAGYTALLLGFWKDLGHVGKCTLQINQ